LPPCFFSICAMPKTWDWWGMVIPPSLGIPSNGSINRHYFMIYIYILLCIHCAHPDANGWRPFSKKCKKKSMFANHFDNFEMEDHCPVLLQDHGCFINLYNHQMVKKGNHILSTCSNLPADLEPTAIVSGPAVEQAMQHCVDEIQHRCLYDQRW
jgi:hypothetical protein